MFAHANINRHLNPKLTAKSIIRAFVVLSIISPSTFKTLFSLSVVNFGMDTSYVFETK